MNKKGLNRPCSGLMDKFLIRKYNNDERISESNVTDIRDNHAETMLRSDDCPAPSPKRSKTRASGFDPSWKDDFPWVEEVKDGMLCRMCIKHNKRPPKVIIGKATWVDIPCITITRKSLGLHQKGETHHEAMKSERDLVANTKKIVESVAELTSVNKQARIAAFRSLYWLAKREIPHTSNYEPLMELCKLQGVSAIVHLDKGNNDKATSQRFVQEAMLAMGRTVQEPIFQAIRSSPYYSILVDETTDVQIVKELIVYIRYMTQDNRSSTDFVQIIPLVDGTADTIVRAITKFLSESNLPLQKMCAIGSDGASVMVGKWNGVAAKLREDVPHLLANHCVAHRLALAVSQSTKNLPYLKTFKDIIDQIFRFYKYSPVRMAALHELQAVLDDPVLKPQQAKDVRWLSHDNATRTLARCLPSILASLEREAQERGDAQAMGLSVFMQSYKFIATLMMMRDILPHLSSLSKAMQTRDAVFTVVQPLVNGTISLLKTLQTSPGENYNSVQGLLKRLHDEGFNIRMPTETQLDDFKSTVYVPFLQNLIDNLDARFPDLPTIMHFSAFDATCFPEESMEHGNTEIKVLAEICNDGSRCSVGEHCCTIGCCYDSSDDQDDDRRYSYGYRLSIWNMWYFWFVILFLMMSCFGGCGYYKHRQRLIGGQPVRGHRNFLSILTEPYNGGATRVLTVERGGYPDNMGYVLSRGTDANLAASMAPPPYAEVMNNPGLFPPNTKTGVPGDMPQGGHTNLGTIHNEPTNQMPQPPPYTEVANQNETGSIPTNQNVQNQSQLTNQVPEVTVTHQ